MKNLKLIFVIGGVLGMAACSGESGTGASSGGSSGQGSGGSSSSGGSTGSGGHASGGSSGSGGSSASGGTVGTGGHTSSGGMTGSGGATSSGGSASGGTTGSGGVTAGSGGKGSGGAAGGAVGSGGQMGSGNAGGGMASSGGSSGSAGTGGTQHWVGTWTASPYYDTNSSNAPPVSLSNTVIRQVAHVSLGGSQIRVQFSNLQSNASLEIKSAHIAKSGSSSVADSTIDTSTDNALAFSGMANVTIGQGKEVWSDPIDFSLAPLSNVTITTAFGSVPSQVTSHSGSRTTSYIKSGTDVTPASLTGSGVTTVEHWYAISGIDVMADSAARGVVAIGDSITDGRGTDTDHNNRWTDVLASRLQMNDGTKNVSMMNQGIGGSNLIGTTGTAAQARFARDVLGQSGVKYVIVLDGVNDIGNSGASADALKAEYKMLIDMAHAKNLLIFGATITPFGADKDYASHDSVRVQANQYIRTGGANGASPFDGVIDFDMALTDGGNPAKLQEVYAMWSMEDGLHPSPAGYQKMGSTPDLTLFMK